MAELNPRFPHSLVAFRARRDIEGELVFDETGETIFDRIPFVMVMTIDGVPQREGAGFVTETTSSIAFGYRTSTENISKAGDVVVADKRLACPMTLTHLDFDDIVEMTDYTRTYRCRVVKMETFNWGTNLWVNEVKN